MGALFITDSASAPRPGVVLETKITDQYLLIVPLQHP